MMRASDLLGSEVQRSDGTVVGHVREVRVVQDGPIVAQAQAAFRVDALLIGRGSLGIRLGYHSGNIKGPWLLNLFFGRRKRIVTEVLMSDVQSWDDDARVVHVSQEWNAA